MLVLGRGDPSELLIQAHEQTANLSQELLLALDAHVTSRHTDTHARTHAHTHTHQYGFSISFLASGYNLTAKVTATIIEPCGSNRDNTCCYRC